MTGCSGRLFFVDAFNAQAAKLRSQSACRNAQKHGSPLGAAHSSMSNFKCIEKMRPDHFIQSQKMRGRVFLGIRTRRYTWLAVGESGRKGHGEGVFRRYVPKTYSQGGDQRQADAVQKLQMLLRISIRSCSDNGNIDRSWQMVSKKERVVNTREIFPENKGKQAPDRSIGRAPDNFCRRFALGKIWILAYVLSQVPPAKPGA